MAVVATNCIPNSEQASKIAALRAELEKRCRRGSDWIEWYNAISTDDVYAKQVRRAIAISVPALRADLEATERQIEDDGWITLWAY